MAKMSLLSFRSFTLLALTTLIVSPAFARSGEKKAQKEAEIKSLEEQIHKLREEEKHALKALDENYEKFVHNSDPKEIHSQLERILGVLHQVRDLLSLHDNGTSDHLNYDNYRHKAHESIEKAEHQVQRALDHDTWQERRKAGEDIHAVHEDLRKALEFSKDHPDAIDGKSKEDLERRATENQHLTEALPKIEEAHQLLTSVDHEVKDFEQEKHNLRAKRDADKEQTKKQFADQIKPLEEQLKKLKKK